jgi:putative FmdB family regulatory protein
MPAYDYDCAACGRRFEVVHGVHVDGPTTCPLCGKGPVRKAISAPAVHFKGSGWAKKERHAAPTGVGSSAKAATDGSSGDDGSSGGDGSSGSDRSSGSDGSSSGDGSSGSERASTTERATTEKSSSGPKKPVDAGTASKTD